jgi:hypothetical protein
MPPVESRSTTDKIASPVIIDMGKRPRGKIKKLRQGQGTLLEDINQAIRELQTAGKISGTAQPVVVVVQAKEASFFSY